LEGTRLDGTEIWLVKFPKKKGKKTEAREKEEKIGRRKDGDKFSIQVQIDEGKLSRGKVPEQKKTHSAMGRKKEWFRANQTGGWGALAGARHTRVGFTLQDER